MRKVLIFGNSGSGKSTLAKHLASTDAMAHFDLDNIAWLNTNPPTRAPLDEANTAIKDFIERQQSWVIEGCYADLIELAIPDANELIFLNLSVEQCISNAQSRPWESHKYSSKAAQDANLDMLIEWIAAYTERSDELSYQAHKRIFDGFKGSKNMLSENILLG